jgi:hypothetical protein
MGTAIVQTMAGLALANVERGSPLKCAQVANVVSGATLNRPEVKDLPTPGLG